MKKLNVSEDHHDQKRKTIYKPDRVTVLKALIFLILVVGICYVLPWFMVFGLFVRPYISLIFHSMMNHRIASHDTIQLGDKTMKVFHVLNWLAQGSSYLSPYAYAVMHITHHKYTDVEGDPHSPSHYMSEKEKQRGYIPLWKEIIYVSRMMWDTRNTYQEIVKKHTLYGKQIDKDIIDAIPSNLRWKSFEDFAGHTLTRIMWAMFDMSILYILAQYVDGISGLWWIVFGVVVIIDLIIAPIHGAIINWYAHNYGYINRVLDNTSKNLSIPDGLSLYLSRIVGFISTLVGLGENYHNNHHGDQHSANFEMKWYEFDPIYWFVIYPLHSLGIFKIRSTRPKYS